MLVIQAYRTLINLLPSLAVFLWHDGDEIYIIVILVIENIIPLIINLLPSLTVFLREVIKKRRIFYGQGDRKGGGVNAYGQPYHKISAFLCLPLGTMRVWYLTGGASIEIIDLRRLELEDKGGYPTYCQYYRAFEIGRKQPCNFLRRSSRGDMG